MSDAAGDSDDVVLLYGEKEREWCKCGKRAEWVEWAREREVRFGLKLGVAGLTLVNVLVVAAVVLGRGATNVQLNAK